MTSRGTSATCIFAAYRYAYHNLETLPSDWGNKAYRNSNSSAWKFERPCWQWAEWEIARYSYQIIFLNRINNLLLSPPRWCPGETLGGGTLPIRFLHHFQSECKSDSFYAASVRHAPHYLKKMKKVKNQSMKSTEKRALSDTWFIQVWLSEKYNKIHQSFAPSKKSVRNWLLSIKQITIFWKTEERIFVGWIDITLVWPRSKDSKIPIPYFCTCHSEHVWVSNRGIQESPLICRMLIGGPWSAPHMDRWGQIGPSIAFEDCIRTI